MTSSAIRSDEQPVRFIRNAFAFKVARILVSAGLVFWILSRIELAEFVEALCASHWWLFAISTGILCVRPLIATLRWAVVLAAVRINVSMFSLFYWYMTAAFFNMFLPTALGGDLVRTYHLAKHTRRNADSVASVLMDRILGFLALIGMAVVALACSPKAREQPTVYLAVLGGAVLYSAVLVALFHRRFGEGAVRLLAHLGFARLAEKARRGYEALNRLQEHKRILAVAFVLSLGFQSLVIVSTYLVGLSLELRVDWDYYFIAIPIIWMLTMLPVSISGIGVRETGFVLFFTAVGVTTADALLLSILTFSQLVIVGLLGGVLYAVCPCVFDSLRRKSEEDRRA